MKISELPENTNPSVNDYLAGDIASGPSTTKFKLSTLLNKLIGPFLYPIGSVYIETTGVNPATTFGFGTWAAYAQGRTLIGVGTSDQTFAAAATGGESTHVLTIGEIPSHNHTVPVGGSIDAAAGSDRTEVGSSDVRITSSTGGGGAHNNLPPYVVTYMWKRTA